MTSKISGESYIFCNLTTFINFSHFNNEYKKNTNVVNHYRATKHKTQNIHAKALTDGFSILLFFLLLLDKMS